ncbi:transcriptional repressor AgaR [Silvibacterium dinghuense]|uniref:DeoR/GlpR transcriptional regulator n=1 Tax=Silvibacterium dinghuense TaxID=1560006 RepID=A0A4Q1SBK3_9BACT|nr:transcriptional repressor AgaR [Silvibacterium dinghuense]RXS94387.1 DeoR/GlpR transcriptional regulator [Silvibacterium dinghuense]
MTQPQRRAASVDGDSLMAEERRQHILAMLQAEGRVIVGDLSQHFGVSQITIRKDLDSLQERGLLQRSHGGALPPSSSALFDPSLQEKQEQRAAEKQRIAAAAVKLVTDGSCVMLDSGTTTAAIAQGLRRFSSLTVITNGINIAAELGNTNFEIILTGGSLRRNSFSMVGPIAEDVLKEMHADILFLGVDAFDVESGLFTPNLLEARVNRAMIAAARRVVAVCDSTKFSRRSLSRIAPISALHHVITDRELPETAAESIRALNVELTLV